MRRVGQVVRKVLRAENATVSLEQRPQEGADDPP